MTTTQKTVERRSPWWKNRQWSVFALTRTGWQEIYCTRLKTQAQADAAAWTSKTNQPTRVEPGDGHITKRNLERI